MKRIVKRVHDTTKKSEFMTSVRDILPDGVISVDADESAFLMRHEPRTCSSRRKAIFHYPLPTNLTKTRKHVWPIFRAIHNGSPPRPKPVGAYRYQ